MRSIAFPTRTKRVLVVLAFITGSTAFASGLKVFGPEFCHQYDAGACINFHYKHLKDAKNWMGDYKYPKGRKAFDDCFMKSKQSDGEMAFCSMVFHREEQTEAERAAMCENTMREKYWKTISGDYAMGLYDIVWNCKGRK